MLINVLQTTPPNPAKLCETPGADFAVFLVLICLLFAALPEGRASEMGPSQAGPAGRYTPATERLPAGYRSPETGAEDLQPNTKGSPQMLLAEDFEGRFPSGLWSVFAADGGFVDAYWKKTNFRSYAGDKSAAGARGGSDGVAAGGIYPHNVRSWAVYGPMDFSNAQSGELSFKH